MRKCRDCLRFDPIFQTCSYRAFTGQSWAAWPEFEGERYCRGFQPLPDSASPAEAIFSSSALRVPPFSLGDAAGKSRGGVRDESA